MTLSYVEMFLAFSVAANLMQSWNYFSLKTLFLSLTYEIEEDEDGQK